LPVGNTGVMVSLDDHHGKSYLQNVNGKEDTPLAGPTLAPGRKQCLHVAVRRKGERAEILAELNGKRIGRWEGPVRSLSIQPGWSVGRNEVFGLGVNESTAAIFRFDLRMLSGKAKTIHLPKLPDRPPPSPVIGPPRVESRRVRGTVSLVADDVKR
jgi:hypothetical protein